MSVAEVTRVRLVINYDMKVRCDGMSTEAANRDAVLKAAVADSVVIDFDVFRQMNRAQRQELVKGARVVYIYHDVIDAAGESGGKVAGPLVGKMLAYLLGQNSGELR